MPIYTYKCKNCGKVMEKFKSMNSNGSEKCDSCYSEAVRVFSPAGIIFKGSGFYTTDYKSGSSGTAVKDSRRESGEKEVKKDTVKTESGSEKSKDPVQKTSTANTDSTQ